MRNLEQLRAQNAFNAAGDILPGSGGGKSTAKKVPAMIIANGFIGALAFAIERTDKGYKNPGHQSVFKAIFSHLEYLHEKKKLPVDSVIFDKDNLGESLKSICESDASDLRVITTESLAYLNYLRRFAKPEEKKGEGNG